VSGDLSERILRRIFGDRYEQNANEDPEMAVAHLLVGLDALRGVGMLLCSQDNRMTSNPMFCLQILVRDVGYDADYADRACWCDSANDETVYDDDKDFVEPVGDEWEKFGYLDRWETVMVAFTESGLQDFMREDGHNVNRRAFRGQTRIYVESFNRCHEMIAVRRALMGAVGAGIP
jgi:hypothetical protein